MTTDPIQPFGMASPEAVFDGPSVSGGFVKDSLLPALEELATHAGSMPGGVTYHEGECEWCDALVLLSRLSEFGKQIRSTPEYKGRK